MSGTANATSNGRRSAVLWSHQDFVKVARELVQRYPECQFEQASTLDQLDQLGRPQLETAMQEALPAHLHKRVKEAWRFKPGVLRALRSLKERTPINNPGHIVWTEDEWKRFAVLLQAIHPNENFMRSPDLKNLRSKHLNAAACEMPLHRQRTFTQVNQITINRLLDCYRAVLAEHDKAQSRQDKLTNATPAAPAPAPAPAVPAPAAAPDTAPAAPVPKAKMRGKDRRVRIFWTDNEWLAVAEELVRQNPKDDFLADVLMKGLTARKVERAQETALPAERWRHLIGLEHVRSRMRMALNKLHRRAAEQEVQAPPVQDTVPESVPELAEAAPPVAAASAAGAFDAAWREACRPLANLLTSEIASQALVQALLPQLVPQLVPALVAGLSEPLAEALRALLPPPAPAARALPFLPPPVPKPETAKEVYVPPAAPKEAKPAPLPKIGVVGMLPVLHRQLEAAFPQVKLICIDSDASAKKALPALQSCVRVIGQTSFMNHSITDALRKHFGHRFCRVSGGLSQVKHQIEVWIKDGALNENYAVNRNGQ